MFPRIGLPVTATDPERYHATYAAAVHSVGGVPVFLPPGSTEVVAGLLLLGGGDVDPARYQAPVHPLCNPPDPARDAWELDLIRRFLADRRPIFGICRGMQVLNVALGGTLIQHLPDIGPDHQLADGGQHPVRIDPGSRLASLMGLEAMVNSRHHQAVERLGRGLVTVATSATGVCEAVELPDQPCCFAVQWHPENLAPSWPDQQALFAELVRAAR